MPRHLKIIHLKTVTSTNDYAHKLAEKGEKEITVVLADEQTKGRGRLKREWRSPKNKGIYASFILRPKNRGKIPLLCLIVSLSILKALKDILPLKIKWPNDLMAGNKKIAGVLLEANTGPTHEKFVIAGIGLNLDTEKKDLPLHATSVYLETRKHYASGGIFNKIIKEFIRLYRDFNKNELKAVLEEIKLNMETLNKPVKVRIKNQWIKGIASGLAEDGALILKDKDKNLKRIVCSEIIHLKTRSANGRKG
ncbi:MAG: biotin--[acetyl-CoA-carboxylase] ligase [Candidatus Omnitrophica bacterium]|nr:biotin--[acetyl-CoA-carboxylase] ligase [Candidatus Omnitrophota bacterium]